MTSPGTTGLTNGHAPWRRLRLGLIVGVAAATLAPIAAHAQTDGEPTTTVDNGGNYVTTTVSDPSIDVSGFSPECIGDAPFIRYTIVPRGFTPASNQAVLVIKDRNGNVVETQTVNSLSGSIPWPGATVDAAGNATDWPGWKLADDGVSWIPDPSDAFLREGLVIEVTVAPAPSATATVAYPPTTSPCANPPRRDASYHHHRVRAWTGQRRRSRRRLRASHHRWRSGQRPGSGRCGPARRARAPHGRSPTPAPEWLAEPRLIRSAGRVTACVARCSSDRVNSSSTRRAGRGRRRHGSWRCGDRAERHPSAARSARSR